MTSERLSEARDRLVMAIAACKAGQPDAYAELELAYDDYMAVKLLQYG